MYHIKKEITKEQYEQLKDLTSTERKNLAFDLGLLSRADICGYGVYGTWVSEENGKYIFSYDRGSSCD